LKKARFLKFALKKINLATLLHATSNGHQHRTNHDTPTNMIKDEETAVHLNTLFTIVEQIFLAV